MMTQYTIEHRERPKDATFSWKDIFVEVDSDDKSEVSKLLALSRYGVTVRPSTQHEEDEVFLMEMDMEAHEDDIVRAWPEEQYEIILQIKDW